MPSANKPLSIDLNSLNQLPVALALYDNNKIYFINQKAVELFKIPKSQLNKLESFSINRFLNAEALRSLFALAGKIDKGASSPSLECSSRDFKGKELYLEINSNISKLNGKKIIQSTFIEISERKKTEELLNDIKQKFELLTNNANDIISFYTYFPEEKYLYVSPNITKILGYNPSELLKDHNFFNKRVLGNKKEFLKIDKDIKELQRKNIVKNYSYVYKTYKKNKEEVWLDNSVVPIPDEHGKIMFYLNVLRDITEHKEKEIEIENQKADYQMLLDSSQVAHCIHHQGTMVFTNKELLKLLKLKKKDVIGKFAADFFHPADRKKSIHRIKEIYEGKRLNVPTSYRLIDSKGKVIEAELKSNLIKYNNQQSILTSIYNISQQRQLEREVLRAEISEQNNKRLQREIKEKQKVEKTLIEKTGQLTSILESSNHLIWSVNDQNEVLSFNKNFYNVLLEKYGIKIKIKDKIDSMIPKGREEYMKFWYTKYKEAFKGKKLEFERFEDSGPHKIYRKIFINPIYDAHNRVIEISCIAHDITDMKVYEQKLFNQAAKLNSI
ncbi:MAG: hypothetical protein JWO32_2004, partial [Bacteroidetes bacterium]|nr:hypothetical protein [Bacteroidota bacterium]